ncbi:Zinc finger protein 706 [Liparis tanakae]|uniref:Zinc finger protein 706 n=1 Tax=Liparis tanakae TaxID=230148 RepID=A0A4Z2GBQ6_9TELE|nr:Zinc finger protein 706 [Liparis tanakae]
MARGHQKIQSQQKNAKKTAEKKKGQAADQKTAAMAALVHTCPVCRSSSYATSAGPAPCAVRADSCGRTPV